MGIDMGRSRRIYILINMIIIVLAVSMGMPIRAEAADEQYRMMHGEQDAIIAGTIKEISDAGYLIQTEHVISCKKENTLNRQLPAEEIPSQILVDNIRYQYSYHGRKTEPLAGDHVIISLDRKEDLWQQVWLAFEVNSTDIASLEIVSEKNMTANTYAWQLFIRSDGEITDFSYDGMKLYAEGDLVFDGMEHQMSLKEEAKAESEEPKAAMEEKDTREEHEQTHKAAVSVIKGSDGPTSIFLAGKVGKSSYPAVIAIVLAAVLLTAIVIRKKVHKNKP